MPFALAAMSNLQAQRLNNRPALTCSAGQKGRDRRFARNDRLAATQCARIPGWGRQEEVWSYVLDRET
jgi:hypothetical protein